MMYIQMNIFSLAYIHDLKSAQHNEHRIINAHKITYNITYQKTISIFKYIFSQDHFRFITKDIKMGRCGFQCGTPHPHFTWQWIMQCFVNGTGYMHACNLRR